MRFPKPRSIFPAPTRCVIGRRALPHFFLWARRLGRYAMNTHAISGADPPSTAIEYPVGLVFDATFDAFAVRLTTLPNSALNFHIAEGPYAHTETVKVVATLIRPGIFLVSWVEASGATVVHVEDFAKSVLYSHATLPDGTFLRMKAKIRLVQPEIPK